MLTSHHCEPNELIAPAVKIDALESIPNVDEIVTVDVSCDRSHFENTDKTRKANVREIRKIPNKSKQLLIHEID